MAIGISMRTGVLALLFGLAAIFAVGGFFADDIRRLSVFAPSERGVEEAIRLVAERERALRESTGNFTSFSNADVGRDQALLGLPWGTFPVKEFFFDAVALDTGHLRLRATPRPESVTSLSARARLYVAELAPSGEVVRSGWYPSN